MPDNVFDDKNNDMPDDEPVDMQDDHNMSNNVQDHYNKPYDVLHNDDVQDDDDMPDNDANYDLSDNMQHDDYMSNAVDMFNNMFHHKKDHGLP